MEYGIPTPVEHRDRALARLRDLTVVVAIGATGLVGAFAILAAATIPGHSDGNVLAATGSSDQGQNGQTADQSGTSGNNSGQTGLRPSDNSFTQSGSSAPIAVSGGSR